MWPMVTTFFDTIGEASYGLLTPVQKAGTWIHFYLGTCLLPSCCPAIEFGD